MIELGAGANTWAVENVKLYYSGAGGSQAAITGGLFKDSNGAYFGGNSPTTTGSHSPENNYFSGVFNAGATATVKRQQLNMFSIELTAATSVIEHRIGGPAGPTTAGNFITQIVGNSTSYVNTPTGSDSSTAFANGAKIGSASPSIVWFNTANAQVAADMLASCRIVLNNSGTSYEVMPIMTSLNINGTTQVWFGIQLVNPSSGAAVSWSTALSTSNSIIVEVMAYLR
jgi:hypothetical protein